jgi:prepilin-type N-terminal cleavage/methylation domain-containing protein
MQTKTKLNGGFTLVEIMIVVAIIGLLAAIAIPNFIKARQASQKAACVANLRTIDGAKATWALEQRKTNTDVPTDADLFGPTSYIREKPSCPAGGSYTLSQVDLKPTCTIADHTF